jgi:hypothetical protein
MKTISMSRGVQARSIHRFTARGELREGPPESYRRAPRREWVGKYSAKARNITGIRRIAVALTRNRRRKQ